MMEENDTKYMTRKKIFLSKKKSLRRAEEQSTQDLFTLVCSS